MATVLLPGSPAWRLSLGRRNRVHVFAPDGRLVTSLSMEAAAVRKRVRQERWRSATPEEFKELRRVLESSLSEGRG